MKIVGVVLAGGLSRRFGSPKAFAQVEQAYFYERAVNALNPHCEEVVIVTRQELLVDYPATHQVILDVPKFAGCGPLAGILSAMESVEADYYVVLPCDMPFINEQIIDKLIKLREKEVTAVIANEKHHPLVSIWRKEMKTSILDALNRRQLGVMRLLEAQDVLWLEGHSLVENAAYHFQNVNTPDDLEGGDAIGSNRR